MAGAKKGALSGKIRFATEQFFWNNQNKLISSGEECTRNYCLAIDMLSEMTAIFLHRLFAKSDGSRRQETAVRKGE